MNAARRKVDDEGECRACGGSYPEAAHLWPRSLGAKGFAEPNLIVPLCRRCHQDFDDHKLNMLPLITVAERRAVVRVAGSVTRALRRLNPSHVTHL